MVSPAAAAAMALRSEPGPLSPALVTESVAANPDGARLNRAREVRSRAGSRCPGLTAGVQRRGEMSMEFLPRDVTLETV